MNLLSLEQRLQALIGLGERLREPSDRREEVLQLAELHNGWFTRVNSRWMLERVAEDWLTEAALREWASRYPELADPKPAQRIGIVAAGNIPAVGLHDVLAVFLSGNIAQIKYSDKDKLLIPYILEELKTVEPATAAYFESVERLANFDKVIATGSNNTGLYFEQYFAKYPHIIRKNRNSVAVLDGSESEEALKRLALDIFRYFGMGCRSVSKLYLPEGFALERLMAVLDVYADIMDHNKYKNNFDYNRSLFLLNNVPHWVNDCIMLLESSSLQSRIATAHYVFYKDVNALVAELSEGLQHSIQCVATDCSLPDLATVRLGDTQAPRLWDYPDGVDLLRFLL